VSPSPQGDGSGEGALAHPQKFVGYFNVKIPYLRGILVLTVKFFSMIKKQVQEAQLPLREQVVRFMLSSHHNIVLQGKAKGDFWHLGGGMAPLAPPP